MIDLIARMTRKEPRCLNSEDSVSWHAYREAEQLVDSSLVDELAEYVQRESSKERRGAAYFILGKLGQKIRGSDCAAILVSHVKSETNKYVLSNLLNALGGVCKPRELDLRPIFQLLQDERWSVRHSAITALRRTDSPEVEDHVLQLLEMTSDPFDMIYCHATLNEIGTAKSLPFIEKNLKSRKRDVKMSAQLAIEAINTRMRGEGPVRRSTFDTPYGPR